VIGGGVLSVVGKASRMRSRARQVKPGFFLPSLQVTGRGARGQGQGRCWRCRGRESKGKGDAGGVRSMLPASRTGKGSMGKD
jgi:hypothetical protein